MNITLVAIVTVLVTWTIIGLLVLFQIAQRGKTEPFNTKHYLVFGPIITPLALFLLTLEKGIAKLVDWTENN